MALITPHELQILPYCLLGPRGQVHLDCYVAVGCPHILSLVLTCAKLPRGLQVSEVSLPVLYW